MSKTEELITQAATEAAEDLRTKVGELKISAEERDLLCGQFLPFYQKSLQWARDAGQIATIEDRKEQSKKARELRLKVRKARVATEKKHKELKEDVLHRGRAIDGLKNTVLKLTKPVEADLKEIEDYAAIEEKKRKDELEASRGEELDRYAFNYKFMSLGEMEEESYQGLLQTAKDAHDNRQRIERQEAEQKRKEIEEQEALERERIAKEKAEQERLRAENERLQKEREKREREYEEERKRIDQEQKAERAKAEQERQERLKQIEEERKETEEKLRKIREKQQADRKEIEENESRRKREHAQKLRKERDAKIKAETEARVLREQRDKKQKAQSDLLDKAGKDSEYILEDITILERVHLNTDLGKILLSELLSQLKTVLDNAVKERE